MASEPMIVDTNSIGGSPKGVRRVGRDGASFGASSGLASEGVWTAIVAAQRRGRAVGSSQAARGCVRSSRDGCLDPDRSS